MKTKIIDLLSNIMSKRQVIFTENFTIFLSNSAKTRNVPNSNLTNFGRPSFSDDINVTIVL